MIKRSIVLNLDGLEMLIALLRLAYWQHTGQGSRD
jgi:hypothetical protein